MQTKQKIFFSREILAIGIILLISIFVKIYISSVFYGQSSDEFANIFLTREVFTSGFKDYPELFMWFYYFISGLLLFFINDAFIATTTISIIFSTASILVMYLIVKKIFNQRLAFWTSLLMLLHPELNLIGSVPLKEPVYTFFILTSLLMLIHSRPFIGAFIIGVAFLTRVEGLLIGMPLYLANIFYFYYGRKIFRIFTITLLIFLLFILFMNIWVPRPFEYLFGTFDFHWAKQVQEGDRVTLRLFIGQLFITLLRTFKYLFDLIGPNLIFIIPGFSVLLLDKEERKKKRSVLIYFTSLLFFWFCYIFFFGKIIYNFHRYFYSLIPFIILLTLVGFFQVYKIRRLSLFVLIMFLLNSMSGYYFYYQNPGRQYWSISQANKNLLEAGQWIENNLRYDQTHRLLIDGIPGFNLFRKRFVKNVVRWDEFINVLVPNDKESFFKFLKTENIKYVVWSNENYSALTIAPYLKDLKEMNSTYGKLVLIKKWKKSPFTIIVFEFQV